MRSDPVLPPDVVARLYTESAFAYEEEVPNLRHTYRRYLSKLGRWGRGRSALLEVGCGNGFALEEALLLGYETVRGVEPSHEARARARADIRENIVCDVMRPGLFEPEEFDVVCLFQVFDHVPDPSGLLDECVTVLRPGGLLLFLHHDLGALSARLLGARSPIVDIEHTYLYTRETLAGLCSMKRLRVREVGRAWNRCSLAHLAHLAPLPSRVKEGVSAVLSGTGLGRLSLDLPLGNLYLIAQKER